MVNKYYPNTNYRVMQTMLIFTIAISQSYLAYLDNPGKEFDGDLNRGDSGIGVEVIQYYLSLIREFNDFIPPLNINSVYE